MLDEHFSRETLERFFRSELSKEESRGFVRHLLRRCPRCSRFLYEVAQRGNFQMLIRGLEDAALDSETDRDPPVLAKVSPFPSRGVRTGAEGEMRRRGRIVRG